MAVVNQAVTDSALKKPSCNPSPAKVGLSRLQPCNRAAARAVAPIKPVVLLDAVPARRVRRASKAVLLR